MLGRQAVAIAYLSLRTAAPFVRHSSVMSASTSPTDAEKVDIISDIDATYAAGKCAPCESLDNSHREYCISYLPMIPMIGCTLMYLF